MYLNESEILNPNFIRPIDEIRRGLMREYCIEIDYQEFVKDGMRLLIGEIILHGLEWYADIIIKYH